MPLIQSTFTRKNDSFSVVRILRKATAICIYAPNNVLARALLFYLFHWQASNRAQGQKDSYRPEGVSAYSGQLDNVTFVGLEQKVQIIIDGYTMLNKIIISVEILTNTSCKKKNYN